MIKINLALKKTSHITTASGTSTTSMSALSALTGVGSGSGSALSEMAAGPLKVVLLSAIVIFGVNYTVEGQKSALLSKVVEENQKLQARKAELQASLTKTKEYDEIKKSLDSDEKVIRLKLETIVKLSEGRDLNVRLLKMISGAIPPEAWLRGISMQGQDVDFQGAALDFNQVSDFTKKLSESELIADVQQQDVTNQKDEAGRPVVFFELKARRK